MEKVQLRYRLAFINKVRNSHYMAEYYNTKFSCRKLHLEKNTHSPWFPRKICKKWIQPWSISDHPSTISTYLSFNLFYDLNHLHSFVFFFPIPFLKPNPIRKWIIIHRNFMCIIFCFPFFKQFSCLGKF